MSAEEENEDLAEALFAIWNVEGNNPAYHKRMKEDLLDQWPILYRTMEKNSARVSRRHQLERQNRTTS